MASNNMTSTSTYSHPGCDCTLCSMDRLLAVQVPSEPQQMREPAEDDVSLAADAQRLLTIIQDVPNRNRMAKIVMDADPALLTLEDAAQRLLAIMRHVAAEALRSD